MSHVHVTMDKSVDSGKTIKGDQLDTKESLYREETARKHVRISYNLIFA